jgi:multiple sugar transport system permease protein
MIAEGQVALQATIGSATAPPPAGRRRWRSGSVLAAVALGCGGVLMLMPFVFMISTSFNADARTVVPFPPQVIPHHPTAQAYSIAIGAMALWRLYGNTLEVEAVQLVLSLASALLAGYSLSKIRPRGSHVVLLAAVATTMIPVEAVVIPNFLTFDRLHLLNTYWPLWLPAINYTFGTFLTKQYLDGIPSELREAARVDGASELRIFAAIYLPLCSAVVATLAILLFLAVWNEYLWPLIVLTDPHTFTIQLGISQFNETIGTQSYALPATNMAATCLSIIPVAVVFLALQRYILGGASAWGLKG